jgi:hypothetical protein
MRRVAWPSVRREGIGGMAKFPSQRAERPALTCRPDLLRIRDPAQEGDGMSRDTLLAPGETHALRRGSLTTLMTPR